MTKNFKEEYLTYTKTPPPVEGATVFSPSQFSSFIEKPYKWYREQILGEAGFTGNTSSVIGTIVHAIAAAVARGEEVDKDAIESYISDKEVSEDYNPDIVRECYPEMAEALINGYVLQNKNNYLNVEMRLSSELTDGYFVGGTLDVLEGTEADAVLTDYKTYSSTRKPSTIPQYYKYQLLVYAVMALSNGFNVRRIRLVYVNRPIVGAISEKTGKQLKSYPSEVTVLTEELTEDDLDFIESLMYLAVDSCQASKKYPELRHVIWHDPRLKITKTQ